MFTKKTIRDIDLDGKRVLLRADYNVPVGDDGVITDDYRMKQSVQTIQYLLDHNVKLIVCSHLGRPKGQADPKLSLEPVAKHLQELLNHEVHFVHDCIGPEVESAVASLQNGQILMLENVRFHAEEEANDQNFAKQLASLADVFVQDAFGVVHHGSVTVSELPKFLPGVSGLLLEKEVDTITNLMANPKRPLMAVIGGAKIADKIDVMNRLIELADFVAIGGAMANTFLDAVGIPVAKSMVDADDLQLAKATIAKAQAKSKTQPFVFYLPQDAIVASSMDKAAKTRIVDWSAHVIADVESYPQLPSENSRHIADDEMILDIGPFSGAFISGGMQLANTVIWNGPLGLTETKSLQGPIGPFAHGTELVTEAMLGQFGHRPYSFVGGGDSVAYVEQRQLTDSFDFVSTGGGASLELMAGRRLPGVEALIDKGQGQN